MPSKFAKTCPPTYGITTYARLDPKHPDDNGNLCLTVAYPPSIKDTQWYKDTEAAYLKECETLVKSSDPADKKAKGKKPVGFMRPVWLGNDEDTKKSKLAELSAYSIDGQKIDESWVCLEGRVKALDRDGNPNADLVYIGMDHKPLTKTNFSIGSEVRMGGSWNVTIAAGGLYFHFYPAMVKVRKFVAYQRRTNNPAAFFGDEAPVAATEIPSGGKDGEDLNV